MTALLAAIVSMVLVAASLFLLRYQEASLKHSILEGLDGQASLAAHGIASFIDDSLQESGVVAATLPVNALTAGRTAEVQAHLQSMFKNFPKFQNGIFVLDSQGKFLVDYPSHPELRGVSFAYREYFQRTMQEQKGIVGKPYRSKRTGLPVITFTAPVRDGGGKIVAIVACSVDLLAKETLGGYRKQKFGKTGYLYVFDKSRQLILHPDDKRQMTFVETGKNKLLEASLNGFEGADETVNSVGVPMLLAVRSIPNAEWIIGVQITQKEAYEPIAKARLRIWDVSGIAILMVVFTAALAIRRVSRPLQQLQQAAAQISSDLEDPGTKTALDVAHSALENLKNIRSHDEIGLLASTLFRLTTKLNRTLGSLQRAAQDWQRTFNAVHEPVVIVDIEGRVVRMNQAAEDWFRISSQKAQGQFGYRVIFGSPTAPPDWPDVASLREHQRARWWQKMEKPHGIFEFTITPVTSSEGTTTGAVLVVTDITERVASEEQIRELAFYDVLTRLPNRLLLTDRLCQAIAVSGRNGTKAGVMFIDLDRFKDINDLYGHDMGDEVLKMVANRIAECLRKSDTLARIGGDEFVVVVEDIDSRDDAAAIAERIVAAGALPMTVRGLEVMITASIGLAFFPEDGDECETLLKNADIAMYRAKGRARNTYQYFDTATQVP